MGKFLNAVYIGKVAMFYIPATKLDIVTDNGCIRDQLHNFFVSNYNAYTHEVSKIQGYWAYHDVLVKDHHERYEISINGNEEKLVDFIANICKQVGEESIYLTIGNETWLVYPEKSVNPYLDVI